MARLTSTIGLILLVIGFLGYFGTGMASLTALIPAVFGLVLFILGRMASDESRRKMAMHIALVVAGLGAIGVLPGVSSLFSALTSGGSPTLAQWIQTAMFLLCLWLIVAGVRSFSAARR